MSSFYISNMEVDFEPCVVRLEIGRWEGDPIGKPVDIRELYVSTVPNEAIAEVMAAKVSALDWTGTESGAVYLTDDENVLSKQPAQPSLNHIFNWQTRQWEDPRTVQDLKDAKWTLIKQQRTQAEYAGFTWDSSTFDSNAVSQQRITNAVTIAQVSPTYTVNWTLKDSTIRVLNQQDMFNVGTTLWQHIQEQVIKGQQLRLQLDAATTKEEIDAITW